ncbi:unnamed protein product [[Actinomadura] parvosata subsp. kistnae]|nr:unnamed protein product [Actinomadura parvosata subsp. kistnae]
MSTPSQNTPTQSTHSQSTPAQGGAPRGAEAGSRLVELRDGSLATWPSSWTARSPCSTCVTCPPSRSCPAAPTIRTWWPRGARWPTPT